MSTGSSTSPDDPEAPPEMIEEAMWDEWFDKQYDLCKRIDRAIDGIAGHWVNQEIPMNKNASRAALYASVLEHCGEAIRKEIDMYKGAING